LCSLKKRKKVRGKGKKGNDVIPVENDNEKKERKVRGIYTDFFAGMGTRESDLPWARKGNRGKEKRNNTTWFS